MPVATEGLEGIATVSERRAPGSHRHLSLAPQHAALAAADVDATPHEMRLERRIADIVLASTALTAAAPFMLAAALAIKLEDGGPLLFRQERVGQGRRPFTMLKLRTMVPRASSEAHERFIAQLATGPGSAGSGLHKLTDDSRVTRVGRHCLRRLSLDELPQLLNVVAGQMSLVGPRPALEYELDHYKPQHFERFLVRPGLTGLWQVSGRSGLGFLEMLELDTTYVRTTAAPTRGLLASCPRKPRQPSASAQPCARAGDSPRAKVGLAVVGLGYWGPNLPAQRVGGRRRAHRAASATRPGRAAPVGRPLPGIELTPSYNDVLGDPEVDGVLIATPVSTHYALALAALKAGKHVFVEKPLAGTARSATS